jgi:hypothetical protein
MIPAGFGQCQRHPQTRATTDAQEISNFGKVYFQVTSQAVRISQGMEILIEIGEVKLKPELNPEGNKPGDYN